MQSLSFTLTSLPPSLPCLSSHSYLCSVLPTILLPSPSSVFLNSLYSFRCLYVPSLSHLTTPPLHSLKPPAACGHMKHFERKRMTETDLDLCCTYMMMFVQSMSLSGLMDLHCLAGICLHATGREPFSSQLNIHNIASSRDVTLSMAP